MLAFIGVYNCKADSKFRVSVPAMFRKIADAEGQSGLFAEVIRITVLICIRLACGASFSSG